MDRFLFLGYVNCIGSIDLRLLILVLVVLNFDIACLLLFDNDLGLSYKKEVAFYLIRWLLSYYFRSNMEDVLELIF